MKNLTLQLRLASLLSLILLACTAAFGQITPLGDTYTNSADPTTNYGAQKTLDVDAAKEITYIQFNLASVPTGASISQATLKLYVNTVVTAGAFEVYAVNGTWTESALTYDLAPALGSVIDASVPITTADKNQYILIPMTSTVQGWIDTPSSNNGIALVAIGTFNATFDSKETATTSHPAELDIVFAGGGGSGITGINTAAGSGLIGGGTSGTLNLSLTNTCAAKQVLQWSGSAWACASAGTGTITGVTAGTDLTGGGTSGNVTLNLNTAATNGLYAQLGAANTFTANQTVNGTLTATSSGTGVLGTATATTGNASGVLGVSQSTSGYGVQGSANATTGTTYGVFGGSQSPGGYGVYGQQLASTGTTAGVYGTTNSTSGYGVVGLQGGATPTPGSAGVSGASTSGFGVSGASPLVAVVGTASGTSGTGVLGEGLTGVVGSDTVGTGQGVFGKSQNIGVEGTSENVGVYGTGSVGVEGITSTSTGIPIGVYGTTASASGYGVEGASPHDGVYGQASGISNEGTHYTYGSGLWGDTGGASTLYTAVLGTADSNYAGLFVNNSPDVPALDVENYTETAGGQAFAAAMPSTLGFVYAIIGDAQCGTGFMALQLGQEGMSVCDNYTLMGDSTGNTYLNAVTGSTIQLRINNQDALTAANGLVSVRGNFTATGTKNFRIDHPLDPANKYLFHAAIESSEVLNLYSGNAVLDDSGEAVVQLPDWFESINKDFRYQLTPIGAPGRDIYIAEEVSGGHFKIAGGKPGGKVSWQVSGVRNDAWEKAHPWAVEEDKGADRGHYLTPDLYGAPETARIGYMPVPPGSEQIVHQRPLLPRRGNASPSQPRTPLSLPMPAPPMPAPSRAGALPHPAAPVSKPEPTQK
jgi:hypothetical protein